MGSFNTTCPGCGGRAHTNDAPLVDLTPKAVKNPCRNICSLVAEDDDHWRCNECSAIFAFAGIRSTSDAEANQ